MSDYPYKMSDADYARTRGWDVGTRLTGYEGNASDTITITALGRSHVLAVADGRDGRESMWTFRCRDWQEETP